MTVHKSQGSTLDRAKVDMQSTFADGRPHLMLGVSARIVTDRVGQAYVAMSRATSMEGLQVLDFRPEW